MIEISIYDRATGTILRNGTAPDWSNVVANTGEGEGAVIGSYSADRHRVEAGRVIEVPAAPAPHLTWVLGAWVDLRMAEHRAEDLAAARSRARLPKSALLLSLLERKVLDAAEVAALAAGTFPPRLQAFLDAADESLRAVVLARWLQAEFGRLDPLIVAAAAQMGVADAALDEIFEVEAS